MFLFFPVSAIPHRRLGSSLAVVISALLAGAFPVSASASSAAFTVQGSNGFSIDVGSEGGGVVLAASERRPPFATFSSDGRPRPAGTANGAASVYYAQGSGGAHRIEARLGALGRISVRFRPSGRKRVTVLRGGAAAVSCAAPRRIVRRLGTFTGTIEFRGEDGYTEVATTRARGSVGTPLPARCGGAASASRAAPWPEPGSAVLGAVDERAGISFRAATTATGAGFRATLRERRPDGLVVLRRAVAGAPPSTFSFDRGLTAARVKPPAPFSGVGHFRARPGGGVSWSGNLRVTFPGLNVAMTGPGFATRLGPGR